jgi:hypothetical protein
MVPMTEDFHLVVDVGSDDLAAVEPVLRQIVSRVLERLDIRDGCQEVAWGGRRDERHAATVGALNEAVEQCG